MTLIDFFDRGLSLGASQQCLRQGEQSMTYGEVAAWTHLIAWSLRASGVNHQAKVATLSPNDIWAYVSMLGLQRAGCVWVPLNARSTVHDQGKQIARTGVEWIFYHSEHEAAVAQLVREHPNLLGAVCIDRSGPQFPELQAWAAQAPKAPFPPPEHNATTDDFRITASGGTTGEPKAVVHTHAGCEANVASFLATFRYEGRPRYLLCMPMTHAAGSLTFPILAMGGSVCILARPDLDAILHAIEVERITTTLLVPTVIYALLARPDVRHRDFSSLRYLCVGAAPLSSEKLREGLEIFGPVIAQIYGQTEASSMLTCMTPEEYKFILSEPKLHQRLKSCGRPSPFARIAIMGEGGKIMAAGERGEVVVRSGMVMKGYLDDPISETQASMHGWHHTGDVGYFDDDGYLYIVDRIRDLIITGGFNVFPIDVEQVLWSHPEVQDCAVIGIPDAHWGETVKAVVQLKSGSKVTEEELIGLCRDKLGPVKSPKSVEFWDMLPKSTVGKVLKREIRATLCKEPS
ncbi:class I adenylate-forming enzyme family protein [Comamonas sp. C11]|uniref:class I adenylate-forming enzyme family protein n=1 Tax=Comamonas sp. C11 TaxID=2966554 RepID=UPI002112D78B|nr:AMP-binding protein [Comamonas sp. C11]UUC96744.1 AMP-binding protein [Comamonas sp. C11]